MKEINWTKVPVGTKFKAKIHHEFCEGKIQKEGGSVYLCQNKFSGTSPKDRLGYSKGWHIRDGNTSYRNKEAVSDLVLIGLSETYEIF